MKCKTFLLALLLCCAPLLALPARAETDMEYTGHLDPKTGTPYGSSSASTTGRVTVADGMYYDWDTHDFVYPLPNAQGEVHANVADGMVTTEPVRLSIPSESGVSVYREGEPYTDGLSAINVRGEYVVLTGAENGSPRLLSFRIQGASTNGLAYFSVPEGFYLNEVTWGEGEEQQSYPMDDRYGTALSDEGAYHIEYTCAATGIGYTLDTYIDRTPPRLRFDGRIDDNGNAHSALTFEGLQLGDMIYLTRGGVPVQSVELNSARTGGTIYDAGDYEMQVFDAAGNMTQYEFTILTYFNLQSWMFFLMVFLALLAVLGYIFFQRKTIKFG